MEPSSRRPGPDAGGWLGYSRGRRLALVQVEAHFCVFTSRSPAQILRCESPSLSDRRRATVWIGSFPEHSETRDQGTAAMICVVGHLIPRFPQLAVALA